MTPTELVAAARGAATADEVFEIFDTWASGRGLALYPAQSEAAIELVSGSNVILSTPTGTGKSLVAVAAHLVALQRGERSYYTAPIKALVSEKFFALADIFGAENVGMLTGDSAVNADAPIICCTAEILANLALRRGEDTDAGTVIMDEFHFYGDADRGWAWQVPLLLLPRSQFLLMSATLGDVTELSEDLEERSGRTSAHVTGLTRPVPLHFSYAQTPVPETIEELLNTQRVPVYIVHFAQADAVERAQSLTSVTIASREHRDRIGEAIAGFRFSVGFGHTLNRLLRHGIGVHHAGMLPKYRRLVERLAQDGLLRVICGTDTLGVGINVPIRSVLLTGLAKYDGRRMRVLSAREFHQISGRAGRAGYDTAGDVLLQAPEHEIENIRLVRKAGDDPKKLKRIVRKKPPENQIVWTEASMQRLIHKEPERLVSRMRITHSMVLAVLAHGGDAFGRMRALIEGSHETGPRKRDLVRRALSITRSLIDAGIVERVIDEHGERRLALTVDLQDDFALNQPLSPFAVAAFELIEPEEADGSDRGVAYALEILSVVEATLDDPRPVLLAQQHRARGEAVAAMKSEGIEYEERMELLEEVSHPKPLEELLDAAFESYRRSAPWVAEMQLHPKSVVRDMYERAMSFSEFVRFYGLTRSEGVLLRYLSDALRAVRHTIPDAMKNAALDDLVDWLDAVVRGTDSSLVDEWAALLDPDAVPAAERPEARRILPFAETPGFRVQVRNALFQRVLLAAREDYDALGELDRSIGLDADGWADALDPYWEEYDRIGTGSSARSAGLLEIRTGAASWELVQVLEDPEGDRDWRLRATLDVAASEEAGSPVLRSISVGTV